MSRLLDLFYFGAWPIAVFAILAALFSRKWRYLSLFTALVFASCWWFVMRNREARYAYFKHVWPKSASELKSDLGNPERKIVFPEGDELLIYSVRSYPWATIQWYSVYKDKILSGSSRDGIGLFEADPAYIREPREAELARELILRIERRE